MLRKSLRKHVSNQSNHFQILEDTLYDATVVVKINLRVKEWAKHLADRGLHFLCSTHFRSASYGKVVIQNQRYISLVAGNFDFVPLSESDRES